VLGIAAGLRIAAARGDLWLDELWSLSFAREALAPLDIWTAIHHDNNHLLNTFALFVTVKAIGAHGAPIAYRVLPLLTGLATAPLLFYVRRSSKHGPARGAGWYALVLCAFSSLAITYSSEARGYAPAAFFGVIAYLRVRESRINSTADRLIFAVWCVFGFLSHLTFLFVYAGLVAWTAWLANNRRIIDWPHWFALHTLPTAFIAADYFVDARHLVYGGGPLVRTGPVVASALSLVVGGGNAGPVLIAALSCTIMLMAIAVTRLIRRRNIESMFYAAAMVLGPAVVLLMYQARFMDVRYFYVIVPFAWLLADEALVYLSHLNVVFRYGCTACVALSVLGNVVRVLPLIQQGRGHYSAAVTKMAARTSRTVLSVGSDQDFPNRLVLAYYAETIGPGKRLDYVGTADWRDRLPDWYVTRSLEYPVTIVPAVIDVHDQRFDLVGAFPYGGVSGWNWFLYRRTAAADGDSGLWRGPLRAAIGHTPLAHPPSS
jgi:hypothetical protein